VIARAVRILIAEDEDKIAALLAEYLAAEGFECERVATGDAVAPRLRERFDLLLLDVMLPGKSGIDVLRELRTHSDLPVIMVTARVEEIDRLLGLELGADDYICKPFSPREVVARIKTVLRRSRGTPAKETFALDEASLRATVAGREIPLTASEFRLLRALAAHPGRVYSRAQLLDLLHDDLRDVGDRAIDSHVKNLRRKLEDYLPGVQCIQSVYGVGYRFEMPEAR
jgi:two-component system, OmpR family, response regulator BaeR